ncbi:hypothetical protein BGZ59_001539 [Podila verticillata]|uniref:Transmembrane protein 135 N-terminal domain-containing protein n=1 Tax=Podila verticillata NRRL 6337 TaxID=1069443 RepID=A0A086TJN7_9FUNG|nr:hypothetical protein BGZ59_001539 [Podila verticillata]KFH62164.1 hypothetical protein MVEG_11803 [Podila verticillata NRRL 6337]
MEQLENSTDLHQLSSDDLLQLNIDRKRGGQKNPRQHENKGQQLAKRFFRTWLAAYLFKYGLDILPVVLTGRFVKNWSVLKKSGGRDTIEFALFFTSYLTIYKTVLWRMRSTKPDSDQWNAFVAGSVAGLSILLDRNRDRRASITRTLFIRAIHFGSALAMLQWTQRIQLKEDIKAVQPKETDSMLVLRQPLNNAAFEREKKLAQIMPTVAPILLLSVATTINIYALFLEPDCMESSYYKFLINISRFPDAVGTNWRQWMELMRTRFGVLEQSPAEDCVIPLGVSTREALAPHLARELVEAVVPAGMRHEYQLCAVLHPNMSCTGNTWAVATGAMTQAGKMYALLYGVMTFVWHHKKLEENPKEVVYRFVTSVVRSTAVSALATSVAANSVCLGRRMFGRERKLM